MARAQQSDVGPSAVVIRAFFAWLIRRRALAISWLALAVLIVVAATGLYLVREGESAVKQRFGKFAVADIGPGLHWKIPFGIEEVSIFPTEKIYRIEVVGEISPRLPMLTGDNNFANAVLAIQYRISNLRQFLFRHENPEAILKGMVRGLFIDTISSTFIDMVLATEKRHVEEQVLKESTAEINQMDLGIELTSVAIVLIEPPTEAIAAFRAVNDARLNKQTVVYQASQRTEELLSRARGDSQALVDDARAQATKDIAQSKAAAARFTAMVAQNQANPRQSQITAYWETVRKIFGQAKVVLLDPGQKPNLAINLIETPEPFPLGLAANGGLDAGHSPLSPSGTNRTELTQHPTAGPVHSGPGWMSLNPDRKPGLGTHLNSKEAHPFPVLNGVNSNLPPHSLGPVPPSSVKNGKSSEGNRQLNNPNKAAQDKK